MKRKKEKLRVTQDNFKDLFFGAVEESVKHAKGKISLKEEILSLPEEPPSFSKTSIKKIRENLHVSQPIFARLIGVSSATVRSWEQGEKEPSSPARKLLQIVIAYPNILLGLGRKT
jgi:putative transcriptional regulator